MPRRPRKADRADQYEHPIYRELQDRIAFAARSARLRKDWTQEEAAHQCSMSTRLLQQVEAGTANLTLTTLARLCGGLELEPQKLLKPIPRRRARPI